ncbi:MAG: Translocation and assembly module TamB [Syntrophorhabdus sp. PtaU1.Bin153]|nr:MAG: Translocation and assembly module TamB [Syntrophorhabdus sp. PtaU1.Bin153]
MRIEKQVCVRILILLIALLIAGVFTWMVGTNEGARFVLKRVSRSIPADTRIGEVKGRIAGNLQIADIRITTPTRDISVEKLRVRWNPLSALTGWIYVKSIILDSLVINNRRPDVRTPIDLTWPRVSGLLSWLKIRTRGLRINGVSFREAGSEVQRIDTVAAQATWYLGGLNVDGLRIEGPLGTLEGTIGASFIDPLFAANTKIRPRQRFYDLEELAVMLKVQKGGDREGLSGMVSLIGMSGKNEQIKVSGPLYFTGNEIILTDIRFREMGRRGTARMTGRVNLASIERTYAADITLDGLSIFKDPVIDTALSGTIKVTGTSSSYGGTVDLTNKGESWKEINMEGVFQGNREKISLDRFKGRVLGGSIDGSLQVSWVKGMKLSWDVAARGLNPERIAREWPGTVNADIQGDLAWPGANELNGLINAKLLKSTVRKRPLTGFMEARWSKGLLTLSDCELHGNGFDISARGALTREISYQARVSDLSGLLPASRGRFSAVGWFRRDKATWSGTVNVEGNDILISNIKIGSTILHAGINDRGIDSLKIKGRARTIAYGGLAVDTAEISVAGKTSNHEILVNAGWPSATVTVGGSGGYCEGAWTGKITKIDGRDRYSGTLSLAKPAVAKVSTDHLSVSPLLVTSAAGEAIEMEADLGLAGGSRTTMLGADPEIGMPTGRARLRWEKVNLARLTPFLGSGSVKGHSSGLVELERTDKKHARMGGTSSAVITVTKGPVKLVITRANTTLMWDNSGLKAGCEILLQDGGRLEGQFSSIGPAEFRWPSSGEMRTSWQDIDASFIRTWLPAGLEIKGKLSGKAAGKLLDDSRFELSGRTTMEGGVVTWESKAGAIQATAEKADAEFVWNKSALQGAMDAWFPTHGSLQGTFRIPVPARFPVRVDKGGPTHIAAKGDIQEKGVVSAIFPGLVEESRGKLSFDVARAGTWEAPDVRGSIRLENAGAYLPSAGIKIKDMGFEALLGKDRIDIASFRSRSGPGEINSSCTLWLKGWGVSRFKGNVKGNRFQIAYLPEFQALANPDLVFEGDGKKLTVNGSVVIPEALIRDGGGKDAVRVTDDLIVIDRPQKAKKPPIMNIDGRILVVLGEKVRVRLEGLDGRMEGKVQLGGQSPERVWGKGELKIVQGKFSSYGIKLDIARGNIIFDGGPVEQASVDVMALRTFNPGRFNEVKAGVTVSGTPKQPVVRLYSEPAMSDPDILSYIVFGRPLTPGETGNQTATLIKSAGSLLGGKRSAGLQDEIRERFGLDTLDVQEESKSAFAGTRSGVGTAAGTGALDRSLVTVGKYLSPRLYVAYGRSVFTDEYLVTARYNLARHLEIESRTGIHSSVDLYYKIEFD